MPLPSQDIGTGAYASGRPHIAVWSLVDGHPRCVEAPLAIAGTPPAQLAAAIARNRALATLCAEAEAVEAAQRLTSQDEPPAWLDRLDEQGQPTQVANPDHAAWAEANTLVTATTGNDGLQHLLRTRADALAQDPWGQPTEPPFTFDPPPVPAIPDPLAQTADWDGQAWQVRDLTEAELAAWPLRPAPSLDKPRFAALLRQVIGDALAVAVLTSPAINLVLTLAGRVDWADIFTGVEDGPGYAQQLVTAGTVTSGDVAALKAAWPLATGD
ncbi:hypothetical protein [Niveispirillum sp. KHB5.9]|uniref:hypothetical protein n=1 Tax=Niveispirillum sp. KHB5.9 TaxID=3400269 RepID=UPI003A8721A0